MQCFCFYLERADLSCCQKNEVQIIVSAVSVFFKFCFNKKQPLQPGGNLISQKRCELKNFLRPTHRQASMITQSEPGYP